MKRFLITAISALMLPAAINAATPEELDQLYDALQIPQLFDVVGEEGLNEARSLQEEMFPTRSDGWDTLVAGIYADDKLEQAFRPVFNARLADVDVTSLIDFFESARGREIVSLEHSARRAMMDDAVEDAAKEAYATLEARDSPRVMLIERLVDTGDLLDQNVAGALNASLAFLNGLADGGAIPMDDGEIVSQVWSSEPQVRGETESWLYGYLAFAYEPLSDDDVEVYAALSETEEGQALIGAYFAGFDELFIGISYGLGLAAAQFMQGEEL